MAGAMTNGQVARVLVGSSSWSMSSNVSPKSAFARLRRHDDLLDIVLGGDIERRQ